jgi:hypothetical protein
MQIHPNYNCPAIADRRGIKCLSYENSKSTEWTDEIEILLF